MTDKTVDISRVELGGTLSQDQVAEIERQLELTLLSDCVLNGKVVLTPDPNTFPGLSTIPVDFLGYLKDEEIAFDCWYTEFADNQSQVLYFRPQQSDRICKADGGHTTTILSREEVQICFDAAGSLYEHWSSLRLLLGMDIEPLPNVQFLT